MSTTKRSNTGGGLQSQSEFNRRVQAGQFAPLYLFEGKETYAREQALKKLVKAAVDESVRDFNYATISVAQGDLDEALALAEQFPMISARRVVAVTDFESINDDKQIDLLKAYLQKPVPTTALVFVTDALDNRRNIAQLLRKSCEVVTFDPLEEKDLAQWTRDYVTRGGAFIEPLAINHLLGRINGNLQRLTMELDKLLIYVGPKGRIGQGEIDELVQYSRELSNFELTDAIVDGDRRRALELLDRIFATAGEAPQTLSIFILGAIASNYRKMALAKDLMRQNAPNSEVAKAVGMSPYGVTRFNERVRRIETARLLKSIVRIAETDVALKSSLATPRLQLELLICELCPPPMARRAGGR